MKDFNEFLTYLEENAVSEQTQQEIQSIFQNSGETFSTHEMKLALCISAGVATTTREILRSYHEWLQKPE